jgi:hypothetical protein
MKKLLTATLFGAIITAAAAATPAFAGNGTAFTTREACLAGIDSAQLYVPSAMANRAAASKPSNGYRHAGVSGRVCVLEHTSMQGSSNGETAGWWWVAIDGGNLMVSSDGRSWRDSRCENAIRRIAQRPQEVATAVAECRNCHQQPAPAAPPQQVEVRYVTAPPQTRQMAFSNTQWGTFNPTVSARAPAQMPGFQMGGISLSQVVQNGSTWEGPIPEEDFDGETKPPVTTPPPVTPTPTPTPLPGPVPGNDFGGRTISPLPNPTPGNGGGLPSPLPNPNNGNFFGGSTGLPTPVYNGGGTNGSGLPSPLPNPSGGGGSTNNFGGFTF